MNPTGGSDMEGSEVGGLSTAGVKLPRIYRGLLSLGTLQCSAQVYYSFQIGPVSFRMLNEVEIKELVLCNRSAGRRTSTECQLLVDLPIFTHSFQGLHA